MLQFKNHTPFSGAIVILPDSDGVDSIYTIIKATFALGSEVVLSEVQVPVAREDQYYGKPGDSSLKITSDVTLMKPGTDVLLHGHARTSGSSAETTVDVRLSVGPVRKTVRVFGDRVWDSGLLGAKISPPQPFASIPLVWERAFGGFDQVEDDPPKVEIELRNPIGTGFRTRQGKKLLQGTKLPNVEYPSQPIRSWKDRPPPAGFGPISAGWEPRKSWAGTYDEAWQKQRAPYLPEDFDSRFFYSAPQDQTIPTYLKGGEPVEVLGVSASPIRCQLPRYHVEVTCRLDEKEETRSASLDTVIIDAEVNRLLIVWRSVLPCHEGPLCVREISARSDPC